MTHEDLSTTLILIRHGETAWNVEGRMQGQLESPLTVNGLAQAQAIGERLKNTAFDAIYSSDLGRAAKTAQAIAEHHLGLTVMHDVRLRERHFGVMQGNTHDENATQYEEHFSRYQSGDPDFVVPGGESLQQVTSRAMACLRDVASRHSGRTIVVVSHGGVLSVVLKTLLGLELSAPRRFDVNNTAYNEVRVTDDNWMVVTLGDLSHLDVRGALDDSAAR